MFSKKLLAVVYVMGLLRILATRHEHTVHFRGPVPVLWFVLYGIDTASGWFCFAVRRIFKSVLCAGPVCLGREFLTC
jgi:hypothetical protein